MVEILRIKGFKLNPNDKIVNNILKRCKENNGYCPCENSSADPKCPCTDYKEENDCHCGLYIKE